ncbi:UDP-N-acetylmuramate--L-alanine ligase [filamentous cyanobacterium CCP5]|nr:UDP-N-acetylmuramate--L-alanine ligase [filamentous cyanobacterium CCP5]
MPNSVDFGGRPFHFIGVGGIGMSALAYILTRRQLPVSGSDLRLTHITQRLQDAGAKIFWHQEAANLHFFQSPTVQAGQLPQVVCSTAITTSNPEYRAALELGCPIFHRSDLLAALIRDYAAIAVAGTHGKTTTSSMIGFLLLECGLDPTIVVGGEVGAWEGNARVGQGPHLVAEADESDGSLAKLSAQFGIVTNIELDHTDHYQSLEDVVDIFHTFSDQCQRLIGCIDCATVRNQLRPDITYSLHPESEADYVADDICYSAGGTTATVWERGQPLGQLRLSILGQHNLSNALAAVALGREVGLTFDQIAQALVHFQGARRRFELRGFHGGIRFIDDYAHHPSEIRATLSAARLKLQAHASEEPIKRVVAVFQPHRYSRAAAMMADFADAFEDADQVLVTDIYAAGEENAFEISGKRMAKAIAQYNPSTQYSATLQEVQQTLTELLEPGDLVIFLGAGNLNQVIPGVMDFFANRETQPLSQVCR